MEPSRLRTRYTARRSLLDVSFTRRWESRNSSNPAQGLHDFRPNVSPIPSFFGQTFHAQLLYDEDPTMIEHLRETRGPALGFAVRGKLTTADIQEVITALQRMIGHQKGPIGVLADLSQMDGANWTARWDEMRFLEQFTDRIARLAIVGASGWEEIASMVLVATAALQAQTLYFRSAELLHAWHWVKMAKHDEEMPVRVMYPGHGLFQDYTPEYTGL